MQIYGHKNQSLCLTEVEVKGKHDILVSSGHILNFNIRLHEYHHFSVIQQ